MNCLGVGAVWQLLGTLILDVIHTWPGTQVIYVILYSKMEAVLVHWVCEGGI
jgi:hypothetical protein